MADPWLTTAPTAPHPVGCDLVQRDTRAAEVAALKARLSELEKVA